jgi:hypothetical protein
MRRARYRYVVSFVVSTLAFGLFFITVQGCHPEPPAPARTPASPAAAAPSSALTAENLNLMVEPGNEEQAFTYYKEIFDELGLNPRNLSRQALIDSQNMAGALTFLGYKDLKPGDVEDVSSSDLMKRYPAALLASAFFAPKITDVSVTPLNVGWRKVIRFNALPGSDAQKAGVASGYLLFNKFQGKGAFNVDPIKPRDDRSNESQTTQLIYTRSDGSKLTRPVYFLVYGPVSKGGKLITFLTATFDARDPSIVPQGRYYVPQPCAECHGGKIGVEDDWKKIKVNYLDTDHWFDRLDDDFAALKGAPFGVLYDGGKDETKPQFAGAFNVLRRLNAEIKEQNEKVEPTPDNPSFQLRAVRKWVELHKTDTGHKDVFARALPTTGDPWKAGRAPDQELLPLMNRYCYRCHSSLRFSVFDRPAVKSRKGTIGRFLNQAIDSKFRMPQDRVLPDAVKKKIEDLVKSFEQ